MNSRRDFSIDNGIFIGAVSVQSCADCSYSEIEWEMKDMLRACTCFPSDRRKRFLQNILFMLWICMQFALPALAERPVFDGYPYVDIQGYDFPTDLQQISGDQLFRINYTQLDQLGRPGMVSVVVTRESVSGQSREGMAKIIPTGFEQAKYPFIEKEYLYQRCHLIGSQFKGDTEIPENIVTGTHYMNLYGMYSIETQVATYVLNTGNSVYYCVIPDFEGEELVCRGLIVAATALGDTDDFRIAKYCFNVEPGVMIDYATGYSTIAPTAGTVEKPWEEQTRSMDSVEQDYILNTKSLKFHYPNCSGVANMKENNKQAFHGSRDSLIEMGYKPCGTCHP